MIAAGGVRDCAKGYPVRMALGLLGRAGGWARVSVVGLPMKTIARLLQGGGYWTRAAMGKHIARSKSQ